MSRGIHRHTANSRTGRSLTSGGGLTLDKRTLDPAILAYNAEVEARKIAKQAAKKAKAAP